MNGALNLDYTVYIWQERDQFIAHALPVDVMSSGRDLDEARQALDEAVRLFLHTAAEMGTLEEILQECGYEKGPDAWISPAWVAMGGIYGKIRKAPKRTAS